MVFHRGLKPSNPRGSVVMFSLQSKRYHFMNGPYDDCHIPALWQCLKLNVSYFWYRSSSHNYPPLICHSYGQWPIYKLCTSLELCPFYSNAINIERWQFSQISGPWANQTIYWLNASWYDHFASATVSFFQAAAGCWVVLTQFQALPIGAAVPEIGYLWMVDAWLDNLVRRSGWIIVDHYGWIIMDHSGLLWMDNDGS